MLRTLKKGEHVVRAVILGLDNSGKTCLLKVSDGEDIDHVTPTQGFNIKTTMVDNSLETKLTCWDIGGQKAIRPYWQNYIDDAQVLVWVIDGADRRRFEESKREFWRTITFDKLAGVPILV